MTKAQEKRRDELFCKSKATSGDFDIGYAAALSDAQVLVDLLERVSGCRCYHMFDESAKKALATYRGENE